MPRFPIAIEDGWGGVAIIGATDLGHVYIDVSDSVSLNAERREAFAQAWVAACHEADRQAGAVNGG